jgi:hypothetical protein
MGLSDRPQTPHGRLWVPRQDAAGRRFWVPLKVLPRWRRRLNDAFFRERAIPRGRQRFSDWLRLGIALGGVLGFLVYATTRGGYEAYFDRFHLTADDVGLSESTVVARTGASLASVLLLVALVALVQFGLEALLKALSPRVSRGEEEAVGVVGVALTGTVLLRWFSVEPLFDWGREACFSHCSARTSPGSSSL